MTLPLGSKLGSYEVLSLLGAGGMGEVYRARDTRLGRVVAIKVLPADHMADENRRRRFVQEARAASALNHPNIVTIHEIEFADGNDFIVMEYVPGNTLDAVIPRQGMRLGEVLRIAIPIADAVARAHAAGIVHRDLKPANVMVGPEGAVKVLDFGLAKLIAQEEAVSPEHETVTGPLSQLTKLVGTAGYMSPEQAAGKKVDARSDVFSFGALLYEMITGRRAFAGNSTAETDGHHLAYASCASCSRSCQVDVVELGTDYVPAGPPRRLTRRPAWIAGLTWTRDGNSLIYGDLTTRRLWRTWIVGGRPPERIELVGLGARQPATTASLDRLAFAHDRYALNSYRFEVGHPPDVLRGSSLEDWFPDPSPDGRRIAFHSRRGGEGNEIWLAAADGSNPMQLTHGPGIWQGSPRWSPDGQRIAFDSQAEDGTWAIWTIDAEGGSPRPLTLDPGNENQPSWSHDGHWIYFRSHRAGAEEIWRIPATGGSEERVTHGGGSYAYESGGRKDSVLHADL
jgi:serine/threonine protein kinase